MHIGRLAAVLALTTLLAACNLGVPEVTPTVAPTRTPSETPVATSTPLPDTVTPTRVALVASPTATPRPPSPTPTASDTALPSVTPLPSLAPPTNTATPTPTATATPTTTPTPTATPTPTTTPTGTPPPTLTPSSTPTATHTPPPTFTPTDTLTPTPRPTATPTATPFPTVMPLPTDTPLPTVTDTPPPTDTPLPTDTPPPTVTDTPLPTVTDTPPPTTTDTPPPTVTDTPPPTTTDTPVPPASATPLVIPTLTAIPNTAVPTTQPQIAGVATRQLAPPTPIPLRTLAPASPPPAPTLDVTPVFITATAPAAQVSPIPGGTPMIAVTLVLPTAAPATATNAPTVIVDLPTALPTIIPQFGPGTLSYALSGDGTTIATFSNPAFAMTTFAQNPADPNRYAIVNTNGQLLYYNAATGTNDPLYSGAFTDPYTYQVQLREENNAAVDVVAWSPDGQALAFIVNADKLNIDGVWVYSPVDNAQLVRDCPPQPGCATTLNRGVEGRPFEVRSVGLRWSPDSQQLLVEVVLPAENGRRAFMLTGRAGNPEFLPPTIRYEYANWSADGTRIIVSGRSEAGEAVIGSLRRDDLAPVTLTRAADIGYAWTQDAVEVNGQLYALASREGQGGGLYLIDGTGRALTTEPIGGVVRVAWSPDRSAVLLVTAAGRYYVVSLNGAVRDITDRLGEALAVEWLAG